MPFAAFHGVVYRDTTPITDADARAVGEVFRTELHCAFDARNDTAWEHARAALQNLTQAEHDACEQRRARVRRARLAAFNSPTIAAGRAE